MKEKKLTGYPSIDKPWEKGKSLFQKHPIIPPVNIYTLIKLINKNNLHSMAISCHENSYSYKQLFYDSAQLANVMVIHGVKRGDIVTVCLPNCYETVVIFLACNKIGAIITCLNAHAAIPEIREYIDMYNSPILFTDRTDIVKSFKECSLRLMVSVRVNDNYDNKSIIDYLEFIKRGNPNWRGGVTFNSKDAALILYTSGTTGKPKSVVLTNENIISAIMYVKNTATETEININKTLACVPFSYPYGLVNSIIQSLLWKKEVIIATNIGINTVDYYLSFKPNMIFGSPALLNLIMKGVSINTDLSFASHFISGGDFLPENLAEKGKTFFKNHGSSISILNGFGNAETVGQGANPVGVYDRSNTVGKLLTGVRFMVIDPDTYEEKRYNEEGLLIVSGKHVFREYYNEPEATKEAKKTINGRTYFKTGTMGYIDKDGYFVLTGRQSRFYINSSLNKVYLDHVQTIIEKLDCVETCAVVKVPDKTELFVNKAFIVLKRSYSCSEETKRLIISQLKGEASDNNSETLKSHEIPTYIEFLDYLPLMDGSEKIDYRALEKQAEEMSKK